MTLNKAQINSDVNFPDCQFEHAWSDYLQKRFYRCHSEQNLKRGKISMRR